jgi:plastocyanin
MRRGAGTVIVLTALAAAVMPALAADEVTITASSNQFTPAQVTIHAGDTVRFANAEGSHNFAFADGPSYPPTPTGPGAAWNNLSRTFTQAGTYGFVCDQHAEMTGTVTVLAATPTPTPTPTPTATPGPPTQGGAQLEVRTLRMTATTFCTKRGPRCRRPGVKLKVDLSQPAEVTGTLSRRPPRGKAKAKRFGRVDFGTVAAGPRTLKFTKNAAGKRLTAGRYTLKLTIATRAPQTLSFRVRTG